MQNLILIGGGGYCKSCIDVIQGAELSIAPQLPNASAFVSLFQIVRLPCEIAKHGLRSESISPGFRSEKNKKTLAP